MEVFMNLASYIDHTILKAETTSKDVERLCREAIENKFAAVCVNPCFVPIAAKILKGSGVGLATVIGFPLGASTTAVKMAEAMDAISNGATEIDMVMAIGLMKEGNFKAVSDDIRGVVSAAKGKTVKVIIETCYLTPEQITHASLIAADAGAHYVKTSTGFGTRGASVEDVKLIKKAVGDRVKIKASGGIKTKEQALAMIEAGASRIGTSSGVLIVS
jgi:deoxyribose-phosphate aldolase